LELLVQNFGYYCHGIFTHLSSNQQCQSIEGWQRCWLGTACCHNGQEILWQLRGLFCLPATRQHPSCYNSEWV